MLQLWKTVKKRDIRMISTIHNSEIVDTTKTDWKTGLLVRKPICIVDYNKYMKGVDRADQYLSYYPIYRKTKKWTKKVVLYLFNCGLFNAFKVYKVANPSTKMKFYDFLLNIAKIWIEDIQTSESSDAAEMHAPSTSSDAHSTHRTSSSTSLQRLSGSIKQHQIIRISATNKRLRRKCKVCSSHKLRKETMYMCKECKVPLHIGDCFSSHHLKKVY
jgi:hypothetical protein